MRDPAGREPLWYRGGVLSLAIAPRARQKFRLLACGVTALGLFFGCHGGRNFFTELSNSRRLAADLRLQFNRASDASNRAVMADTDEASKAFAGEAEQALQIVDGDVAALTPVLRTLNFPNELELLEEFGSHYAAYRELDHTILALAVDNTNLKAQHLAFGPAREAADDFQDALARIALGAPPKARCNTESLVAGATLAVRDIQVLFAPHIAESDDALMTKMEQQMAQLQARAESALESLASLAPATARPALSAGEAALDRFKHSSNEIVALSRRNTNVRSLELSLRAKPPLTTACDESLRALGEALSQEDIKATR